MCARVCMGACVWHVSMFEHVSECAFGCMSVCVLCVYCASVCEHVVSECVSEYVNMCVLCVYV